METHIHDLQALFAQLGLDDDEIAIDRYIAKHRPLKDTIKLHEAAFWSPSQAVFLEQSKAHDADWAEIVDELDAMLRG